MRRVVVAVVVLAGCGRLGFDPAPHSDGGGSGNTDAPSHLDDGGAATCNSVERIADTFATDQRATLWGGSSFDGTTSGTVSGGQLTLSAQANAANTFAAFRTLHFYDLRGRRTFVRVSKIANASASTGFGCYFSPTSYVHLEVGGGQLAAVVTTNDNVVVAAQIPYDGATDAYWGLSERGGRLYFETSSDGTAFTSFYDQPEPFDVSLVAPTMYVGTTTAVANPGSAVFSSFNGGTASTEVACPAADLVDTFDDGVIGHLWENSFVDPCCQDTEPNGHLELFNDGASGFVARRSSAAYELRDSSLEVMTTGPDENTTFTSYLEAIVDADNYLELLIKTTGYQTVRNVATNKVTNSQPRMSTDKYIRIRETSGTVYFEASADKTTWRTLESVADPIDLSNISIGLEGGRAGGAQQTLNTVEFDDLNVP